MNTSVDVLAVMQELDDELQAAATYSGEGCYWFRHDDVELLQRSAAARAAVAELIDKVDSYVTFGDSATAYRELSEALARVRGA
ncbi:hypothetical protein ACODUO_15065 [Stenotrophomonas maltophilia]